MKVTSPGEAGGCKSVRPTVLPPLVAGDQQSGYPTEYSADDVVGGDVDVRHLDGDKLNNAAENLCWGTRSENNLDAVAHGTNANTAKAACPLGHALQAPNLCSGAGRKCRACSLARAARQRADRRGNRFDFDAYADRSYCRILAGDVKVYARRAA